MVCPYCGAKVEADWNYCASCERTLPPSGPKAVKGKAPQSSRTAAPEQPTSSSSRTPPPRPSHPSLALVFILLLGLVALALGAFFLPPLLADLVLPSVFAVDGSWPLRDRPTHSLMVSADGKAIAYVAATAHGQEYLVVKRGDRVFVGKAYPAISGLVLSADASHWAYIALRDPAKAAGQGGGAGFLVHDEAESQGWDYLGSLGLSRDGKRLACVAASGGTWAESARGGLRYGGGNWTVLVDGKAGDSYDHVDFLSMSEDGRHLAFAASRGQAWGFVPGEGWDYSGGVTFVIRDGSPSPGYDLVSSLALSRDGKRLVYAAFRGGEWLGPSHGGGYGGGKGFVHRGEGQLEEYDWLGALVAGPGLSSWAIATGRGGEWIRSASGGLSYGGGSYRVLGPEGEGEAWDGLAFFQASADGSVLAYAGGRSGEWRKNAEGGWSYGKGSWTVVAGQARFDLAYKPASLSLSPDGRHFAFYFPVKIDRFDENDLAWWYSPSDRPLRLVLDGKIQEGEYAGISSLALDDSGLSVTARLEALAPEETRVTTFSSSPREAPRGLASALISSPDGKKGLWIASDGDAWRLVVSPRP
jgi:hypothetical protein